MCENTKSYTTRNDINKIRPYSFKCNAAQPNKSYICEKQSNNYREERLLKFNYTKTTEVCNTGCLPDDKCNKYVNPISYDKRHYIIENKNKEFLPIGPKRVNHQLENIWNNQRL
tara:strand:- start:247 stop:588 length:342 start_codon:yes stop_codon:yes gene_type:complete